MPTIIQKLAVCAVSLSAQRLSHSGQSGKMRLWKTFSDPPREAGTDAGTKADSEMSISNISMH